MVVKVLVSVPLRGKEGAGLSTATIVYDGEENDVSVPLRGKEGAGLCCEYGLGIPLGGGVSVPLRGKEGAGLRRPLSAAYPA